MVGEGKGWEGVTEREDNGEEKTINRKKKISILKNGTETERQGERFFSWRKVNELEKGKEGRVTEKERKSRKETGARRRKS